MIPEIASAAEAAVMLVTPILAEVGKGAANKLGEESAEGGLKLLGWLRDKMTGRAREALNDLEDDPGSEDNRADLRKQLAKQLESQPDLLVELRSLLPQGAVGDTMTLTVSGTDNKAAQIKGTGNTTTIG
jgi:hypothetical protein